MFSFLSKSFTEAPNFVVNSEVSNFSINSTPLWPLTMLSQVEDTSLPFGLTVPRPVMTTRLP